MTTTEATLTGIGALVAFWIVGAYNRMVRLRSDLVARFGAVDERYRHRHALIENQLEMLSTALAAAAPRLEALRAACRQADTAREHARARPGAASVITSLRVADEILADARARLPVQSVAGVDLPDLNARLATSDSALAFARGEFNAAVAVYNEAVRQFPTALVARLFSFRAAAAF
ncbi:MAG TPA: LemA family protein [Caldimonas sp.]|jgi:LemA protein